MAAMRGRMRKEIAMLESDPPFGACPQYYGLVLRVL
jgi:hypothetical protein